MQVAVKLTQGEPARSASSQSPLLDIVIRDIQADVVDRKWDTQGSVTMREVVVLDHITPGMCLGLFIHEYFPHLSYEVKTDLRRPLEFCY